MTALWSQTAGIGKPYSGAVLWCYLRRQCSARHVNKAHTAVAGGRARIAPIKSTFFEPIGITASADLHAGMFSQAQKIYHKYRLSCY